jgi:hypothetical protein
MGTSKGREEEGGVVSRRACCGEFAVGFCVWVSRSTLGGCQSCRNRNISQPVAANCDC